MAAFDNPVEDLAWGIFNPIGETVRIIDATQDTIRENKAADQRATDKAAKNRDSNRNRNEYYRTHKSGDTMADASSGGSVGDYVADFLSSEQDFAHAAGATLLSAYTGASIPSSTTTTTTTDTGGNTTESPGILDTLGIDQNTAIGLGIGTALLALLFVATK